MKSKKADKIDLSNIVSKEKGMSLNEIVKEVHRYRKQKKSAMKKI